MTEDRGLKADQEAAAVSESVSGVSPAAGRERPVISNEKLTRTSNIEHRTMYAVYFKKTERSDIHNSSFDNRHSLIPDT
jgi:hypothetical protein